MRGWRAGERGAAVRCLSPVEEGLRKKKKKKKKKEEKKERERDIFGDCDTSICQVESWTLKLAGEPEQLERSPGWVAASLRASTLGYWVQPGGAWRAHRALAEQSGGNLGPSSARLVNLPERLRLKMMRRCD